MASLYCTHPWEASAKEATNVQAVFELISEELIERMDQLQSLQYDGPESFSLHTNTVVDSSQKGLYMYCCGNG